jgi:NADH dehydrogenase [ubiquinone] 1 alpha subcomplex assembly factor 7
VNDLARELARRIRDGGSISVADYMASSSRRYYATRDPFGASGDFVTAPEVSQMFGELIGLWCAATWREMGAPPRVILAELGPGRGTLLRDALRAARLVPEFLAATELHLVETSDALRDRQRDTLAEYRAVWHDSTAELPDGPAVVIANEFFDALPLRQFVRGADGWHERRVALADDGFAFVLDAAPSDMDGAVPAAAGAVREVSAAALALAEWLGRRVARQGGAALLIDYGYTASACGDTLQALKAHRRHDVLCDPGEADLTAHVDFAAIAAAASAAGARLHGPLEQGMFLRALGIEARAARLMEASPQQAVTVAAGLRRLTDREAMGGQFKVLAIADPRLPPLAGFAGAAP